MIVVVATGAIISDDEMMFLRIVSPFGWPEKKKNSNFILNVIRTQVT